jgi:hypothetical protein
MVAPALYAGMMMETFTSNHADSAYSGHAAPEKPAFRISYIQAHWQQFLYQIDKCDCTASAGVPRLQRRRGSSAV